MKVLDIKVVSVLDVNGKEIFFADLAPDQHKRIAEQIHDNSMISAGYRRKRKTA